MRRESSGDATPAERGAPQTEPADDLEDGHRAIDYSARWINNADTKAGLLSAAVAVVLAGTSQQAESITDVLSPAERGEWVALSFFVLLAAALIIAIVALATVITPRTPRPQAPSRFGFPTLASPGWRHAPATRAQAAEEAWGQAQILSNIANLKFKALRVASIATFSSLPLFVAWSITASHLA